MALAQRNYMRILMLMSNADMIAAFAKDNPTAARRIFDARIATETNADRRAELELAREYHCDAAFSALLAAEVAR